MKKFRMAGVVVLFHPGPGLLENIQTYLHQVEMLFAVDNSEEEDLSLRERLKGSGKIELISPGKNMGVARALNIGAERALEGGFDLLLTMDQDSRAEPDMLPKMLECGADPRLSPLGILAPRRLLAGLPPPVPRPGKFEEELTVVTSGNLVNLEAFRKVGPFREDLFIDYVDFEYCLRMHSAGFKVATVNDAFLHHQWGNAGIRRFLFKDYAVSHHPPLRRYYMIRNRFFVSRLYQAAFPGFYRSHRRLIRGELFQIILFEKEKIPKIKMMVRGYLDYRKGRMGKINSLTKNSNTAV